MSATKIECRTASFAMLLLVLTTGAYADDGNHGSWDSLPLCQAEEGPECIIRPAAVSHDSPLYCGDIGADPNHCIPYDGDIAARPSVGPWRPCLSGAYFPGFNCIEIEKNDPPISASTAAFIGDMKFGSRDVIVVVRTDVEAEECVYPKCHPPVQPWRDFIWHGPGHESDGSAGDSGETSSRDDTAGGDRGAGDDRQDRSERPDDRDGQQSRNECAPAS